MPTVKVENKSDDDIIITLDGEEKELSDGESIFFENKDKGNHQIIIHRKRVPRETLSGDEPKGLDAVAKQNEKPGSHIQLDSEIVFCVNSSKTVVDVVQDIKGIETLHEDVIFVGYTAELAGANFISKSDRFASKAIKKNYVFQQMKGAFLPVGLVGIIILFIGALFSLANLSGGVIKFGSNEIGTMRSVMLFIGGVLVTGYFIVNVLKIRRRAKELWPEK